MILRRIFLCLSLLFSVMAMKAQGEVTDTTGASLPVDVYAYWVVVESGQTSTTQFGHAAIRMVCPSAGLDYCFTTKTPEITSEIYSMLSGQQRMGLVPEPTAQFRQDYVSQGRGITEYKLRLTPQEARQLWQALDKQVERGLYLTIDYVNNSCTQVAIDELCNLLRMRPQFNLDSVISATIPVQTRRQAIVRYVDPCTWKTILLASCYSQYLDEEVSPRRLLVMPQDAALVFQKAGLVDKVTEVTSSTSVTASGWDWFTPLFAAVLFLLLCVIPFRWVDVLVIPLQVLALCLFLMLWCFAESAGIGFNWLILALFPLTAPVGIVYMLCHLEDIYSLAQLFFVIGCFIRFVYCIYHHRHKIELILTTFTKQTFI
jgi:hypothetical protein